MSNSIQPQVQTVETAFQRHARRPGGKPKAMAIADAEKAVEALSSMGENLIRTNIELLRGIGDELKTADLRDASLLDTAYRHTVEMAEVASFFQMRDIAEVAINFSELLFRMWEANDVRSDAFQVHVEALQLAFAAHQREDSQPGNETLVAHLKKVVAMLPDPDSALNT